jgi:hypothetical protein
LLIALRGVQSQKRVAFFLLVLHLFSDGVWEIVWADFSVSDFAKALLLVVLFWANCLIILIFVL